MNRKNALAAFAFFFFFWFGVLYLSGTFTAGFHFTDDHQIIGFSRSIDSASFVDQAVDYISGDISSKGRFFPLYDIHRLVEVKLFGADFFIWAVYGWLLATAASACFAFFLLMTGFSLAEALLFPLMLFLGFQAGVWWRFGTAETIGMPLLSFMLVVSAIAARRPGVVLDAVFVVLGVMLMLSKEAFILFVPAVVFLRIWTHQMINDAGWAKAALSSLVPGLVLLALAGAEIIFIKFFVGMTGMGYAGYEGFSVGPFISALVNYLYASHAWLVPAGVALALATAPKEKRIFFPEVLPSLILLFLSVVPQALIYAKSGVAERYILPGAFGFAFVAIKLGLARLPEGAGWLGLYGTCVLAGIGFTMSLFIGTLAWESAAYAAPLRLGVLAGSLASGLCGYLLLRVALARGPAAA